MATPININNASLDELKTITGISDKRAQKIIKKRKDLHLHLKTWNWCLVYQTPCGDPLIQSGEITLEQEKKEYIAEKVKETEYKSSRLDQGQGLQLQTQIRLI
jgi:predicted DNA-binding helix-hairpin-helix protein